MRINILPGERAHMVRHPGPGNAKNDKQKYTTYNHEIQTSDLGAQGIFYRLRAGAFADKNAASAACATLKKQGLNDCIAKER